MISMRESAVESRAEFSSLSGAGWPSAVLASPDAGFRSRVRDTLVGMRWRVQEAEGGAEALAHLNGDRWQALILDSWLPDLEIDEFIAEFKRLHPTVDLVVADEGPVRQSVVRGPRRNELLHAVRSGQDGARGHDSSPEECRAGQVTPAEGLDGWSDGGSATDTGHDAGRKNPVTLRKGRRSGGEMKPGGPQLVSSRPDCPLAEMIGGHPLMLELGRRVHLVAPHATPVLIQGATGTGKELIARAIHRLSPRAGKPFVALNCAAIPEALLESELFGHARGAFTGAVQRRTGRIQAADGGTLLLDEIGDMPLALQAKLLRFVESGELQPVGDNETVRVDVRIIAATHRPLARLSREGAFRADLYYRLAVFLITPPPLSARAGDIVALAEHFLAGGGQNAPIKLTPGAIEKLRRHTWPGNVRELQHVLGRAVILAEQRTEITPAEIEFPSDPSEV